MTSNNTKTCKSDLEIKAVSENIKMYFITKNSYFDTSDFSQNPIKTIVQPYFVMSSHN